MSFSSRSDLALTQRKRKPRRDMAHDPFAVIADYYDLDLGDYQEDIPLYENLARRTGLPVLELGVGTGRVAIPLAEAGFSVVGVDSSEPMLAVARSKLDKALSRHLRLILAEIEGVSLDESFGLILCPLGGFLHLNSQDKQIRALECARRHLAAGGLVALDLPSLEATEWEPGDRGLILEWTRERLDGTLVSKFASVAADRARQVQRVTHIYEEWTATGSRRRVASFELRYVHRFEMELLLAQAGLKVDGLYGSYDLEPYDSHSPRMVFLAGHA
jgi:SAM-dependent methyltransferase